MAGIETKPRFFIVVKSQLAMGLGFHFGRFSSNSFDHRLDSGSLVVTDLGERQCVGRVERVPCWVSLASQPFRAPYLFV